MKKNSDGGGGGGGVKKKTKRPPPYVTRGMFFLQTKDEIDFPMTFYEHISHLNYYLPKPADPPGKPDGDVKKDGDGFQPAKNT